MYTTYYYYSYFINRSGYLPLLKIYLFSEKAEKSTQNESLNRKEKVVLELAKIKGRLRFNCFNLNAKVNSRKQETEKVHKFCLFLKHYHQYSVIKDTISTLVFC